ncbi:MAG: hypothetical protein ACOC54_03505, partial [Candidatus Sumerlaeota bacterium]
PAVGPWHDTVYLVQNPDADPEQCSAGAFLVAENLSVGPGETYSISQRVRVPGSVVGPHVWMVVANSAGELIEGRNMANNESSMSDDVEIDVPELVIGGSAMNAQFSAAGEGHWYKFEAAGEEDVLVSLDSATEGNAIELYLAHGYMPARDQYAVRNAEVNASDVSALAPQAAVGTH